MAGAAAVVAAPPEASSSEPPQPASASTAAAAASTPQTTLVVRIAAPFAEFLPDSLKPVPESTTVSRPRESAAHAAPAHITLAVVLQVRGGRLQVLLWQRAHDPYAGAWSPPGRVPRPRGDSGALDPPSPGGQGGRPRALAPRAARDALRSRPQPRRMAARHGVPRARSQRTSTRPCPATRTGIPSTRCPTLAFDHGAIALAGRERLRAKLSYTNAGFALAPETFTISELRDIYAAALGHAVSTTNLQRVLLRRGLLLPTGGRREPGPSGAARSPLPVPLAPPRDHGSVRRPPASGSLSRRAPRSLPAARRPLPAARRDDHVPRRRPRRRAHPAPPAAASSPRTTTRCSTRSCSGSRRRGRSASWRRRSSGRTRSSPG